MQIVLKREVIKKQILDFHYMQNPIAPIYLTEGTGNILPESDIQKISSLDSFSQ